ncbi:MAG: hypothetical protein ACKOET_05805 [Verrucomicrobiota bacterium]
MERRIGRWMGKYPAAARWLKAERVRDEQGWAPALTLSRLVRKGEHSMRAKGASLLRTHGTDTDPATRWRWSRQRTPAAALRTAQSDIGLSPVFHQKTGRVDAPLRACCLSLTRWRTREIRLSGTGLGAGAPKRVQSVATNRSPRFARWTGACRSGEGIER